MNNRRLTPRERARIERVARRKRNLVIFFASIVGILLILVLFGPWGPIGSALFNNSKPSDAGRKNDSSKKQTVDKPEDSIADALNISSAQAPLMTTKFSNSAPPAVAIVVDDVGNEKSKLPIWTSIDAPISFAVMPYPPLSVELAEELYNAGYEIMMHIPTENKPPNSFSGRGQLSVDMNRDDVFRTLDADLATIPHVVGVNNHQGGRGCDDLPLMTSECEWAKQKGFFVVDSNSSNNSQVAKAAVSVGLPWKKNQVFIDHQNDPSYIRSAMRKLASIARKDGYAIGICHWHRPNTAITVKEMMFVLAAEGIHFVFAKDINNFGKQTLY